MIMFCVVRLCSGLCNVSCRNLYFRVFILLRIQLLQPRGSGSFFLHDSCALTLLMELCHCSYNHHWNRGRYMFFFFLVSHDFKSILRLYFSWSISFMCKPCDISVEQFSVICTQLILSLDFHCIKILSTS